MPEAARSSTPSSIQADTPSPELLPYATTKAAIQNFTGGLAQMLGKKGIRGELRRPGPDLDAAHPRDHAGGEGEELRQERGPRTAGQPAELAPVYVLLASEDSSYMAGATVAVTGGKPLI